MRECWLRIKVSPPRMGGVEITVVKDQPRLMEYGDNNKSGTIHRVNDVNDYDIPPLDMKNYSCQCMTISRIEGACLRNSQTHGIHPKRHRKSSNVFW